MHDLALRIHFDSLTRALFCDQRVAVREPLAAEDLMRLADVIEHRLATRGDLTHTRGLAAVAEEDIPIRQHLEDHRGAWRLELPDQLPIGIEFDKSVRPFAILGQKEAMFDRRFSGGAERAEWQSEGQEGNEEAGDVHGWRGRLDFMLLENQRTPFGRCGSSWSKRA
jgi:hypothetical protein